VASPRYIRRGREFGNHAPPREGAHHPVSARAHVRARPRPTPPRSLDVDASKLSALPTARSSRFERDATPNSWSTPSGSAIGRRLRSDFSRALPEAHQPDRGPSAQFHGALHPANSGDAVCALFRLRSVDPEGDQRLDATEVGVYEVRGGRIVRSQMFRADSGAVARFLEEAGRA
jgi:hypothetical protein